jgi:cytochrome b6-f complex iron-sulfur subunit
MTEGQNNERTVADSSRRSFLTKLWIGLGLLALIECVVVVIGFLRTHKPQEKAGGLGAIVEAGEVDKFPPGSVTAFVRGKFYLARLEDGGFLALSRKCTHLGCTVPWLSDKKKFECPCHASTFDIRGEVIGPPAPRPLDLYHVFIENKIVKVDTGKLIKRGEFRPDQAVHPKQA